jgi:hypothetical protein
LTISLIQTRRTSVRIFAQIAGINVDKKNPGKHWTAEQVANTFAPHPDASKTTLEWLQNSGIDLQRVKHSVGKLRTMDTHSLLALTKARTQLG